MKNIVYLLILLSVISCKKNNPDKVIETRNFKMGFSTWSYGPETQHVDDTYNFIFENGDIYSEQVDDVIPWEAWINNTPLPTDFIANIDARVAKKPLNKELLLSVSLLNTDRSEIIEGFNGSVPTYTTLNDTIIENAYFNHLKYLVDALDPNYLVVGMESNDLLTKDPAKWEEYKSLMSNIRTRIKAQYPSLQISESITLHGWFEPEVDDPAAYVSEIESYINQFDFAAISFYPFFKGEHKRKQFQKAFDFLHSHVSKPIAFVETTHLANKLEIEEFDLSINSNEKEQQEYLETLLINANNHNYKFIIWWAYRDYDLLWETFPTETKGVGKLWRDTGILDGDGNKRRAYDTWVEIFAK